MPKKKDVKKKLIREEWPLIRKVMVRSSLRFLVDGRPHRERKYFKTAQEAEVQADLWARELENQGIEAMEFPTELRMQAIEGWRKLEPFGRTIREAVNHYIGWLEDEKRKKAAQTVSACLTEWLNSKQAEFDAGHLAPTSLQELKSKSNIIREAMGMKRITEIDQDAVQNFIDSLPHAPRGKLNIRVKLAQFLNYCRRRKWIDRNPTEMVKVRVASKDIEILTPKEAEALLTVAEQPLFRGSVLPYVAISLFGGLRPGEAEQLRWEFIHFDTGEIEVLGKTSKTRETRFVKMEDTLVQWLTSASPKKRGSIVGPNFLSEWKLVRSAAGYKVQLPGTKKKAEQTGKPWPKDVLRHTFGSYWLAKNQDRARLAEQMGNTVEVIKAHYKRAIPAGEAEKFWALCPPGKRKVIPMPAAV